VNLERPPLLAALRAGTVRDKVSGLRKENIGPASWTPHWFRHGHATAPRPAGAPEWVAPAVSVTHVQTTPDLYGWVREDKALRPRRTGSRTSPPGRSTMAGERRHLHAAGAENPCGRLWLELPEPWEGPVNGDGIDDWERITENGDRRTGLSGLPDLIAAEPAWMPHWQAMDGIRSSVLGTNQAPVRGVRPA
jgi:hypothetical protein